MSERATRRKTRIACGAEDTLALDPSDRVLEVVSHGPRMEGRGGGTCVCESQAATLCVNGFSIDEVLVEERASVPAVCVRAQPRSDLT